MYSHNRFSFHIISFVEMFSALGGAKESNTTEMNKQEQRHDAATYETVFDSGRQPYGITRSPLYEETSVVDNPAYGVVPNHIKIITNFTLSNS